MFKYVRILTLWKVPVFFSIISLSRIKCKNWLSVGNSSYLCIYHINLSHVFLAFFPDKVQLKKSAHRSQFWITFIRKLHFVLKDCYEKLYFHGLAYWEIRLFLTSLRFDISHFHKFCILFHILTHCKMLNKIDHLVSH